MLLHELANGKPQKTRRPTHLMNSEKKGLIESFGVTKKNGARQRRFISTSKSDLTAYNDVKTKKYPKGN